MKELDPRLRPFKTAQDHEIAGQLSIFDELRAGAIEDTAPANDQSHLMAAKDRLWASRIAQLMRRTNILPDA